MNTDMTRQSLNAVSGDAAALQSLAQAIAAKDAAGVRSVLSGRGVELDEAAAGQVLAIAAAGDASATFTCTCTWT